MTNNLNEETINERMNKALKSFQNDLNSLRTGRASANMLDPIFVEVYGSKLPINQVGNINVPEPRMLTVSVWDVSNIQAIEKSLRESNLGLNPQIEGNLVRIPIPTLSQERRKELAKVASKYSENARISIRNIRREFIEEIRTKQKKGQISEDEKHNNEDTVQNITNKFVKQIEDLLVKKENEILEIS